MKKLLLFILFPIFTFGQIQIGSDIDGEAAVDQSGRSVSMSSDGNTITIGAVLNDGNGTLSGHVRVYTWDGANWIQKGLDIDGEAGADHSAEVSLSSDGNTIAIGAPRNDGNGTDSGHVRVYNWDGANWTQKGLDIDGEATTDNSGWSVSLSSDGNTVAVGAPFNEENGSDSGQVRIYNWNGANWIQKGLDIDGEAVNNALGWSVSLSSDGNTVVVGVPFSDGNGSNSGHVRVYNWDGANWIQKGLDIEGEAAFDLTGWRVSMSSDGNTVAVGARDNDGNGPNSGEVKIYNWDGANWIQKGLDIEGEAAFDASGWSISLSSDGNTVAIGARDNDGNGNDSGHVRVYDLSAILATDDLVLSQFNLYPNPVKQQFTIKLAQDIELQKVNIYNNLGQFITSTTTNVINTTNLSQGFYFVEIITNKGKATKKIIVK